MIHAIFRIRKGLTEITDLCIVGKKKGSKIERKDAANAVCDKMDFHKVWPCDIEELEMQRERPRVKELFKQIPNENKFFI